MNFFEWTLLIIVLFLCTNQLYNSLNKLINTLRRKK